MWKDITGVWKNSLGGDRMCFFYAFSKALLFCCSSLASVKCWNVCRDILKSCTMSIKFAEQYIFFGVRVTFSVCHFLGITPSDPLRMLALWSRPAAAGLQELQVSGTAANLRIIAISRKELEKLGWVHLLQIDWPLSATAESQSGRNTYPKRERRDREERGMITAGRLHLIWTGEIWRLRSLLHHHEYFKHLLF